MPDITSQHMYSTSCHPIFHYNLPFHFSLTGTLLGHTCSGFVFDCPSPAPASEAPLFLKMILASTPRARGAGAIPCQPIVRRL
ncbi:hypothetical protein E4T56_gene17586 [Termitomyces sp. T112]|nr:hypothetical protein E4T56_gene17586 [Termitomyces sp. T112]